MRRDSLRGKLEAIEQLRTETARRQQLDAEFQKLGLDAHMLCTAFSSLSSSRPLP